MRCFCITFCSRSLKSGVYFRLLTHFNLDQAQQPQGVRGSQQFVDFPVIGEVCFSPGGIKTYLYLLGQKDNPPNIFCHSANTQQVFNKCLLNGFKLQCTNTYMFIQLLLFARQFSNHWEVSRDKNTQNAFMVLKFQWLIFFFLS